MLVNGNILPLSIDQRDKYGNRLQNIYLDYKWNCVAFADAGLFSICSYNFGLLELDNFAIDLRWIAFLQLEKKKKKRYPF